jgi:serine/threonine-protein kinase
VFELGELTERGSEDGKGLRREEKRTINAMHFPASGAIIHGDPIATRGLGRGLTLMTGDAKDERARVDSRTELDGTVPHEPDLAATLPHQGPGAAGGVGTGASAGGRFRVVRFHARGGLGEVFVARDQELHREVALKQIQDQFVQSAPYRARFLVEAEVTGALEHPGVVPVYGLGQDADGRPFYAMRFIQGDTLKDALDRFHQTAFADPGARELEFRKLLRRFLDVCNTMAYAHSRGVLHRDLKPNNVLLGPYGETLVVDWGLAKVIGGPDDEPLPVAALSDSALPVKLSSGSELVATEMGERLGTPAYMSPEQAEGRLDLLGPASDVYSLGATLYYVLAGRGPFDHRKGLPSLLESVRRGDFARPRSVATRVPPALEAVCLKAMALRPEDRYATPRTLAEDLDRWLADEPVSAWREPWPDRARRWLKRHRTGVTGLVIASVLAAGSLGAVSVQRELSNRQLLAANRRVEQALKRAEGRVDLALGAIDNFQKAVEDNLDVKDRPDLKPLRRALLQAPLDFYKRLRQDIQSSREARPEALTRLADATYQLALLSREVDSRRQALASYREAVAALEPLMVAGTADARVRADLVHSLRGLAVLLAETGQPEEALQTSQRAMANQEALVAARPGDEAVRSGLAACRNALGCVLQCQGRMDEAHQAYRRALELREALLAAKPDDAHRRVGVVQELNNLAALEWETRQYNLAIQTYQRVLPLVQTEDQRYTLYFGLAKAYDSAGQSDPAANYYRKALEVALRRARAHPSVTEHQSDLARARNHLGGVYREAGKLDQAEAEFRASVDGLEELVREHPDFVDLGLYLGAALANLGDIAADRNQPARAITWYDRSIPALNDVVARRGPGTPKAKEFLGFIHRDRGNAHRLLGHIDAARDDYESALRFEPDLFGVYKALGRIRQDRGEYAAALADYRAAVRVNSQYLNGLDSLAWLLATCPDARYRNGAEAVTIATRALNLTDGKDSRSLGTLAAAYAESGDFAAAVRWQTKALEHVPKEIDAPDLRKCLELYQRKTPFRDRPPDEPPRFR